MNLPMGSGPVAVLNAHALSVRAISDALVSAFRAGLPVQIVAEEWKRPSLEAVVAAVMNAAELDGVWAFVDEDDQVREPLEAELALVEAEFLAAMAQDVSANVSAVVPVEVLAGAGASPALDSQETGADAESRGRHRAFGDLDADYRSQLPSAAQPSDGEEALGVPEAPESEWVTAPWQAEPPLASPFESASDLLVEPGAEMIAHFTPERMASPTELAETRPVGEADSGSIDRGLVLRPDVATLDVGDPSEPLMAEKQSILAMSVSELSVGALNVKEMHVTPAEAPGLAKVDDYLPPVGLPERDRAIIPGDVLAEASYGLIALQQTRTLANLHPRPAHSPAVGRISAALSTQELLRELAALEQPDLSDLGF